MIYEMYCPSCDEWFVGDSPADTIHLETEAGTPCGATGFLFRTLEQGTKS